MSKILLLISALALIFLMGGKATHASDLLTAVKITNPPVMASGADDPAWANAPSVVVPLIGGANFKDGGTAVTIKAVYANEALYMLLQYDDPTLSVRRTPYQRQSDGTWKKLRDPNDKGGDENVYYEDKVALLWNINNSTAGFGQLGCMTSCHMGEPGKPFGNKYTRNAAELGDIWHVKLVRTVPVGQSDDQYLDHTRFDRDKTPRAGRRDDPMTGGGYVNIALVDGKPEFMHRSAVPSNAPGGTYFLRIEDRVPFDDTRFKPGDEVASIMIAPFKGDRGDVTAAMSWKSGRWTVVLRRNLVTGSPYDVQFTSLAATYEFGVAAFDNAQVRHAFHVGAVKLKFAQ